MNLWEGVVIAVTAVWSNKLRSFLTLLGNIIAVTFIIATVAGIRGINEQVTAELGSKGADVFTLGQFGMIMSREEWLKAQRNPKLTIDDADELRARVHLATHVAVRSMVGTSVWRRTKKLSTTVFGRSPDYVFINPAKLAAGRHLAPFDDARKRSVVVLGADVAQELFGAEPPVTKRVLIEGRPFEVIGVAAAEGTQFYARLEDLSQLADFTATRQADGTFTVLLGGQVPLLIGNQAHRLQAPVAVPPPASAPFPGAPPTTQLLDSEGNDVTALIIGGRLGGLIELRNEALPSLIGGGEDQGRLNRLAQAFADTVNGILLSGEVTDPPSTEPVPLFVYDTAHPGRAAATIALNPDITPETLAAIQTTPSFVQNGIPLQLAALRDPSDPTLQLDGMNYGNFVIDTVAGIGTRYQRAASDQELENRLLVQAQNLRQQTSGVSLEQEAVMLLQFQRAYQATSQVVKVIDEMTQSVLGMLR